MNINSVNAGLWRAQGLIKPQAQQNLPGTAGAMNSSNAVGSSTATQFMNFMKQTPEEQIRDAMLAKLGITKAQFDAMSPGEKQKILAQIENEIKQKAQEAANAKATQVSTNILV